MSGAEGASEGIVNLSGTRNSCWTQLWRVFHPIWMKPPKGKRIGSCGKLSGIRTETISYKKGWFLPFFYAIGMGICKIIGR